MSLLQNAKNLRRNLTPHEQILWQHLRAGRLQGFKFKRQQPLGKYIVDFICLEAKLVIELDGSQHALAQTDKTRDAWLHAEGYTVLRFWNNELTENLEGVLEAILIAVKKHHPLPSRAREVACVSFWI